MDIKTLQYLEGKVEQGKAIQKSIEILNHYIERADETNAVTFTNDRTGDRFVMTEGRQGAVVAGLIKALKEIAEKEIERLKTEFEEL